MTYSLTLGYLFGFPSPVIEILTILVILFVVASVYIGLNFRAVEYDEREEDSEVSN